LVEDGGQQRVDLGGGLGLEALEGVVLAWRSSMALWRRAVDVYDTF